MSTRRGFLKQLLVLAPVGIITGVPSVAEHLLGKPDASTLHDMDFTDGEPVWIRATFDIDSSKTTFYTSGDSLETDPDELVWREVDGERVIFDHLDTNPADYPDPDVSREPASGEYLNAPENVGMTGDLDIRCKVECDDWENNGQMDILEKWGGLSGRSYRLAIAGKKDMPTHGKIHRAAMFDREGNVVFDFNPREYEPSLFESQNTGETWTL